MAMTVNIRYTGKNGNARNFAEEMNRSGTVAAIRAEAGNLRYEYCQPLDDPETILLIDSWMNQESIDIHHASVFQKIFHLTTKRFAHTKQSTIICDQFTPEDPSFGEALTRAEQPSPRTLR